MFRVILLSCMFSATAATPAQVLDRADRLYLQGRRQEAMEQWERMVAKKDVCSPLAEYNLGTAYLKQGDRGKAVLHLLRATLLFDGDRDTATNLAVARSRVLGPGRSGNKTWYQDLREVSSDKLCISMLCLAWLFSLIAGLAHAIDFKKKIAGSIFKSLCLGLVPALVFNTALLFATVYAKHGVVTGVVMERRTMLQSEPVDDSGKILNLVQGEELEIIGEKDDFLKVSVPGGPSGYVKKTMVEKVFPVPTWPQDGRK
ncbi:MAG: hypothetical protein GXP49_06415 [Deltaproteobacteria bacterium]|nr:hypothetical protein [Deltaproteobacteria bacterium]